MPYIPDDGGLKVLYDQTIGFQLDRESPFSVWGQNSGLEPLLWLVKAAVVGLAVAVAFVPRRRDTLQVAALGAAVLIATQFDRGPLVLPLHRVVRPVPARGAVRRVLDGAASASPAPPVETVSLPRRRPSGGRRR